MVLAIVDPRDAMRASADQLNMLNVEASLEVHVDQYHMITTALHVIRVYVADMVYECALTTAFRTVKLRQTNNCMSLAQSLYVFQF